MMSPLKPTWPWGFRVRNREAVHSPSIFPSFYHVSIIFSPITEPSLCPCDPPVFNKRSIVIEYKVSYRITKPSRLFSMNDTNQLPVLTHHEHPGTEPTHSSYPPWPSVMVLALFRVFSMPISAWSMGHCPSSIPCNRRANYRIAEQ